MVNEPTAAALAYGLDKKLRWDGTETVIGKIVLVYDLGGGTFDVTILSIDINVEMRDSDGPASYFDVLGTDGDTHLGGKDFDARLVQHFLDHFKTKHGELALTEDDKEALSRLQTEAERVKKVLSTEPEARARIESLSPHFGHDLDLVVTRTEFQELCADIFTSTIIFVDKLIHNACKMNKASIQEVVLIGGSTRIPKIRQLLAEYFDGVETELNFSLNPDEAVAIGATLLAATLVPSKYPVLDVCLTDVTSHSLGILVQGYEMSTIVKRFTPIPLARPAARPYTTFSDNQNAVALVVYEGESAVAKENNKLGMFLLHGIPPARKGVPIISVEFDIDGNGILHVSATETSSGVSKSIAIKRGTASEARGEDKIVGCNWVPDSPSKSNAREKFQKYVHNVLEWLQLEEGGKATAVTTLPNVVFVQETCEEAMRWLETHPNASAGDCDEKMKALQRECSLPKCVEIQLTHE